MKLSLSILSILFLCSELAYARMYQWVETDTGTTQLSGKPPSWYRSEKGGPRIFVFDNGRLIDDTAVPVSDVVRQRMRQQAFILGEEDEQKAQEKIAKSLELKKGYESTVVEDDEQATYLDEDDSGDEFVINDPRKDSSIEEESDSQLLGKTVDDLKELISEWEESQSEEARQTLEE